VTKLRPVAANPLTLISQVPDEPEEFPFTHAVREPDDLRSTGFLEKSECIA
jgi:hypothetical protein